MGLLLCKGIRERYPEWRYLADGDGGDENLKDYPIEEILELHHPERRRQRDALPGGMGRRQDQALSTYSGGLSRAYVRNVRASDDLRIPELQS
ncbi:MAG: hypothetical protein QM736_00810 [Vicinamibacterales bacterium]